MFLTSTKRTPSLPRSSSQDEEKDREDINHEHKDEEKYHKEIDHEQEGKKEYHEDINHEHLDEEEYHEAVHPWGRYGYSGYADGTHGAYIIPAGWGLGRGNNF